jgi:hypothetical protein
MTTTHTAGFGVAGNFTGHLEQAGEAADFVGVKAEVGAPKGLFPWYVHGHDGPLGAWPVSTDTIDHPGGGYSIQTEPEVGLSCAVQYGSDGLVRALLPDALAAWNDCSIRRPLAPKISRKKNWGPHSKGCAAHVLPIKGLAPGGRADTLRLASFLVRDGVRHAYGEDSPVVGYSYFHQQLLDWLVDRLNHQIDEGPLEHLRPMLAHRPPRAWISIGATRYTPFGEATMLEPGDESIVAVYDPASTSAEALWERLDRGQDEGEGLSILRQLVIRA